MSEAAVSAKGKPTKSKGSKAKKSKMSVNHPKYTDMSVAAINALKEKNGSSRQAILKYIMDHYNMGKNGKAVNTHLKMALKRAIATGLLKHAKGQGASGSFRVSDKVNPTVMKKVTEVVKTPIEKVKVEKVKKEKKIPKRSPLKKITKAKKAKSPKKVVKAKKVTSPKKSMAKKRVGRPKKLKSPVKAKK